jgi:hypothetical protein
MSGSLAFPGPPSVSPTAFVGFTGGLLVHGCAVWPKPSSTRPTRTGSAFEDAFDVVRHGWLAVRLPQGSSCSPLHRPHHRSPLPWAEAHFGRGHAKTSIAFRPRGFPPPRRLPPPTALRACCIPLPIMGSTGFRRSDLGMPAAVSALPHRCSTLQSLPLPCQPHPRHRGPLPPRRSSDRLSATGPTSGPCSDRESVAPPLRCQTGALDALLGFPPEAATRRHRDGRSEDHPLSRGPSSLSQRAAPSRPKSGAGNPPRGRGPSAYPCDPSRPPTR